jgi:hypothetical protein
MGASLLLTCAVIDDGSTPDWQAAERHIDDMTVEQFQDNDELLDQFDPDLVAYDEDTEDDIEPAGGLDPDPLRERLREDLRELREGVEGERTDIDYLLVRGARVWVTGGMSWGDPGSELSTPIYRLHLTGALAAAGFDDGSQPTIAGENAGCDRCGTNDRASGSRYCQACIEKAYRVFAIQCASDMLHDTAAAARGEAFLVAAQTEGRAEIRGPGDYRERVELATARPGGGHCFETIDRDALRLVIDTLEEHAGDSDNPGAMLDAAARLEAMLDAAQSSGRHDESARRCPNCGGPDGYPSEHAVGCPYGQAAELSMPEGTPGAEPRGSVDVYLEVSGIWAISHLTRDWEPGRRAALLAGDRHAKQALLDAAEQATLDRPDDIVRTVQTVTVHAERPDDAALATTTSDQPAAGAGEPPAGS